VQRKTCPSDETLAAFNLGDLPDEELDVIREHQESCPDCEARARLLEGQADAFIDDLRRTARSWRGPSGGSPLGESGGPGEGGAGADRGRPGLSDYEVVETLGAGSMGVVYKARHLKLERVVALKMIPGRSSQAAALFQVEAKAVAQLQHPNIVQIFEIGRYEGQPFLALEFIEGGSLDRELAGRPQPPRQAAEVVRLLALAADYAHRQGIVHCDLKPSNILVTPEGVPKIADFGVAKWLKSAGGWGEEGDVVGTPRYMAPEQATGSVEAVGPAADIYSLGVLLYEMLTGKTPYHSTTSLETLNEARDREPVSPRQLVPKLPADLEAIVLKCLRKDPAGRYADARALADDLGRFLAGAPVHARKIGRVERAVYWGRRHPVVVSALVFAAFGVAGLGLFQRYSSAMRHRFEADLQRMTRPETVEGYADKPVLVTQKADGSVRMRAFEAALSGTSLVLEPRFGNIGHWHSVDDRAAWTFRVDRPARFVVALEYANSHANAANGNVYQVVVGGTTLRRVAVGTGSWSIFQSIPAGEVALPAGVYILEVRSAGNLKGALFDLRAVSLTPR